MSRRCAMSRCASKPDRSRRWWAAAAAARARSSISPARWISPRPAKCSSTAARPRALSERELTALRRKRIGFVFQFFQLLPTLTVLENVELPLLLAGETNTAGPALDRLRWVGLADKAAVSPASALRGTDAACRNRPRAGRFARYSHRRRAHRQSRHRQRRSGPEAAPRKRRADSARPS